jgi:hypothetical protein
MAWLGEYYFFYLRGFQEGIHGNSLHAAENPSTAIHVFHEEVRRRPHMISSMSSYAGCSFIFHHGSRGLSILHCFPDLQTFHCLSQRSGCHSCGGFRPAQQKERVDWSYSAIFLVDASLKVNWVCFGSEGALFPS